LDFGEPVVPEIADGALPRTTGAPSGRNIGVMLL
jgi:hypothetical protein